jgi:hypothetical protein
MDYITREQQARRMNEIIEGWKKRIKHKGDYWWRKVEQETGLGDYLASDEGMHWSDNPEKGYGN